LSLVAKVDIVAARAAKLHLARVVSGNPKVAGIGIMPVGGRYALAVDLFEAAPELDLPAEVDGVDVHVEVTGRGFPQRLV
jgi:hypothetical protein